MYVVSLFFIVMGRCRVVHMFSLFWLVVEIRRRLFVEVRWRRIIWMRHKGTHGWISSSRVHLVRRISHRSHHMRLHALIKVRLRISPPVM